MKKNQYYRGKYLIGVYGPIKDGETLIALCDNGTEFAEFLGIKLTNATMILSKIWNKKCSFIRFQNMCCTVEFIPYD